MPTTDEIRKLYLDYFQSKGHTLIPSSSLIPATDPTLLLTTAGMVQMVPYFLGRAAPPARRMTTVQKCFRTTDIDSVGDYKHLTFFEMLGNFSVGDYFKRDAIAFAWELLTDRLGLAGDRMYVTIHIDDDEAYRYWTQEQHVPPDRIYRYASNWWGPPGAQGPCGPCSEQNYDFGAQYGCGPMASPAAIVAWERSGNKDEQPGCHPNCDNCERFLEVWNLVFMQFFQDTDKKRSPLPAPNIDTGMGLERIVTVLQGKRTVYDTDIFQPLLHRVATLAGTAYGENKDHDAAIRVVAEHARGATFLIADGVVPSNEGRGYVLRRLIRRAVRYGRKLGLNEPFLGKVAEPVIERFRHVYPELRQTREFVLRVLQIEEERFGQVLETWQPQLEGQLTDVRLERAPSGAVLQHVSTAPAQSSPANEFVVNFSAPGIISGGTAFLLHDTYGFPPEVTQDIAREHGFDVDMVGFEKEMEAQRDRARASTRMAGGVTREAVAYEALGVGATRFLGYDALHTSSVVLALIVDGRPAQSASQGTEVEAVLRETPFYAEKGGQVGDHGVIAGPSGTLDVTDTQSPALDIIVHRGVVSQGELRVGDTVSASVDPVRRMDVARNHTATHMLHAALRQVLGTHVRQAGSHVGPDRLRFDFSHVQALTPDELRQVEALVNDKIRQDLPVDVHETTYTRAVQEGALAFFGETYGASVRVVEVGECGPHPTPLPEGEGHTSPSSGELGRDLGSDAACFSKEVCGGTHLHHTGEIGLCLVLGEQSVGAGTRRLEAVSGRAAEALVRERFGILERLAQSLVATLTEVPARVTALQQELETARERAVSMERTMLRSEVEAHLASPPVGAIHELPLQSAKAVALRLEHANSADALREAADWVKAKVGSGVVALGAVINGQPAIVVAATSDLVKKGVHAGRIARQLGAAMGGGGGGKPDSAQAGGKDSAKLDDALRTLVRLVEGKG